jgi:predicted Zn-dependent protease
MLRYLVTKWLIWLWGHPEDTRKRRSVLTVAGIALTVTPASVVAPLGLAAIHAAYNRDQEREADVLGIELTMGAQFDPNAAIRFHERLREHTSEVSSVIATHPSSDERIRNIRLLIESKNSAQLK